MSEKVELGVNSQLKKIIAELEAIAQKNEEVGRSFKDMGKDVGETFNKASKKTENSINDMASRSRQVLNNLKQDFKTLLNFQGVMAGFKLSEQFKGTITQSVSLGNTIRKVGETFGWTKKQFLDMQMKMTKGLGSIGLSSEAAANALAGIAKTAIRDESAIIEYSKTAGMLASIGGEKGREGEIAQNLAGIAGAQGKNPNDVAAMRAIQNEVLKVMRATGRNATEVSDELLTIYKSTNEDFKGQLEKGGSTSLATAGVMAGPESTEFLKKYLGMNKVQRSGLEAQGFGQIMNPDGSLNVNAIKGTIKEAQSRGLDVESGLQTFGFSPEEAKGFIALAKAIEVNGKVIEQAQKSVVDINKSFDETKTLGDAFSSSLERMKSKVSGVLGSISQVGTDVLNEASKSDVGAAAVSMAGATAAAVLMGGGIKGLGKTLLGKGKEEAYERLTGEKIQPVKVMNFDEMEEAKMSENTPLGMMGGKLGKLAKGAVGVGLAYEAGSMLGSAIEPVMSKTLDMYTTEETPEGFKGNALERLLFKIDQMMGGAISGVDMSKLPGRTEVTVKVETKEPNLRVTPVNSRGVSQ